MRPCVLLREDEPTLADLVREMLEYEGFEVVVVVAVEELLAEAARRSPCVALVDGASPSGFDCWWLGPKLLALGVPALAFTAHARAAEEFAHDPHGYAGVVLKPFEASDLIQQIKALCSDAHQKVG